VLGLLSKRHHVGFGVRVGDSVDIHAVLQGGGVCEDDGAWSPRGSLQVISIDVRCNSQSKP